MPDSAAGLMGKTIGGAAGSINEIELAL